MEMRGYKKESDDEFSRGFKSINERRPGRVVAKFDKF